MLKKISIYLIILLVFFSPITIHATQDEDELEDQLAEYTADLEKLNSKLEDYNADIKEIENTISQTEEEIAKYNKEITKIKDNKKDNKKQADLALIALQENTNSNIGIEYIFNSEEDIIDQINDYYTLTLYSLDLVNYYVNEQKLLEYNTEELNNSLDDQEQLLEQKVELTEEINTEIASYQEEIDDTNALLVELQLDSIDFYSDDGDVSDQKEELMATVGIASSDYDYVDYIVTKESNWNFKAENSSSGAYGLCQSLPASKMASAGSDYLDNPVTQLSWCNSYAVDRYGSWSSAYDFWLSNNWW